MGHENSVRNEEGHCIVPLSLTEEWKAAPSERSLYANTNLLKLSQAVSDAVLIGKKANKYGNSRFCLIQFRLDMADSFDEMLQTIKQIVECGEDSMLPVNKGFGYTIQFVSVLPEIPFPKNLEETLFTRQEYAKRTQLSTSGNLESSDSTLDLSELGNQDTPVNGKTTERGLNIHLPPNATSVEITKAVVQLNRFAALNEIRSILNKEVSSETDPVEEAQDIIAKIDEDLELGVKLTIELLERQESQTEAKRQAELDVQNEILAALAGRKLSVEIAEKLVDQLEKTAKRLGVDIWFKNCPVRLNVTDKGTIKINEIGKSNKERLSTSKTRFPSILLA